VSGLLPPKRLFPLSEGVIKERVEGLGAYLSELVGMEGEGKRGSRVSQAHLKVTGSHYARIKSLLRVW
jgi:hypothetical protein